MEVRLQRRWFAAAIIVLAFMVASGCNRMPQNSQAGDSNSLSDSSNADSVNNAAGKATETNAASTEELPFEQRNATATGKSSSLVPDEVTIPAGTSLSVRLQSSVSSATAESGQQFDAVLAEPIVVKGRTVAKKGTPVIGRVVQAKKSGRLHDSGYLRLALSSVEIRGKEVPVQTSSVFAQGAAHKKRNMALIGGGGGAGALIGGLAGGGKGALIGGAVGAAAGTTGAYATGKKDVTFGAERRLTFRLTESVIVR